MLLTMPPMCAIKHQDLLLEPGTRARLYRSLRHGYVPPLLIPNRTSSLHRIYVSEGHVRLELEVA
jgi:hypothetical protein